MITIYCLLIFLFVNSTIGDRNKRLIGGELARDGEFPFVVSILKNGVHHCGGSIMSVNCVLTSRLCVWAIETNPEVLNVVYGTVHRNAAGTGGTTLVVANIVVGEYVALLRVEPDIIYSSYARRIPFNTRKIDGGQGVVMGWGSTGLHDPPQKTLHKLTVTLMDDIDKCKNDLQPYRSFVKINSKFMCGTTKSEKEGICAGDGGNPLVRNGEIIGVAHMSIKCALGVPDVYIRISEVYKWILDQWEVLE